MLSKLNYYSRYHRTKDHHDILSLYNLINGLNLDVLVSQDVSLALPTPGERNKHPKRIQQKSSVSLDHQSGSHRSSIKNRNKILDRHQFMGDEKGYSFESRKQVWNLDSSLDRSPRENQYVEASPREYQYVEKSPRSQNFHDKKIHQNISIRSGANSRSLEEMQCLKETQSINSIANDWNKSEKSPKIWKEEQSLSAQNQNMQSGLVIGQLSSIDGLGVKKCSSHESGEKKLKRQQSSSDHAAVQADSQEHKNLAMEGASSQNHREEDIYSEQFMDDINRLIRNNDDDRKSTQEVGQLPEKIIEHCKSELLDRMRGSDIQMWEDENQIPENQEYPTTTKKDQHNKSYSDKDIEEEDVLKEEIQDQLVQDEDQEDQDQEENEGRGIYSQNEEDREDRTETKLEVANSSTPINNLNEIKETMSQEGGDHQQVQNSAVIQRINFVQLSNDTEQQNLGNQHEGTVIRQQYEGDGTRNEHEVTAVNKRKCFKKVITNQNLETSGSGLPTRNPQSSPLNFKKTKKLNPRLVTSTIMTEGRGPSANNAIPVQKKVNFKKVLMRGEENQIKSPSQKEASLQKSRQKRIQQKGEEGKKLLQAFFASN